MKPYLLTPDETKEFFTNERCFILERLDNHDTQKPYSIARARVERNTTTAWHRLKDISEVYYILQGHGFMEIAEEDGFEVRINDIVKIPPNTAQRITNTGEEDLIFLAICNPPFTDENYESMD